ncbi:MAG: LarC family nickel insertion protein [Alphaproteobacteria bacterium]
MSRLHLHLDPVGGIAGDMFVAALLDAWPEHADGAIAAVRAAGLGEEIGIEHRPHRDEVLVGSRFVVSRWREVTDGHAHVHWRDLQRHLAGSALDAPVRERAIAIFGQLAAAEAGVHGVEVDAATFHEVGAWDSIADIVAAAFLIEAIGAECWSVGALPLGSGRVHAAHGELPVPAPATARLLQGFVFQDDGRPGERVTPTGAAILKQLGAANAVRPDAGRLLRTGHGFGLRRLDGISNILRVLAFDLVPEASPPPAGGGSVGVVSFEVDDQTPEDLAIGLDRVRAAEGVLDLVQMPVFAKKGRVATSIRLLVLPEAVDGVIQTCFAETTTLGVRWRLERRAVLARSMARSDDGVAVKLAERPGGRLTAKAESDHVAAIAGHAERDRVRRSAEIEALSRQLDEEDQA